MTTGLAADLARNVRGEVRFDDGSRALYATDASNYRQVPIGVVVPVDAEDVLRTLEVCRGYDAPVLARGGGTSLAGQCCNAAVVLDFSKYMDEVLDVDPDRRVATVQPGTRLDVLRAAAERHHLTFAPDPSTHEYCTLGGMIGNNSCGVHSVMGGKTEDNVEELDVVTYDGLRMRVGPTSEQELDRLVAEPGRRGDIYRGLRRIRDRYGNLIRERFPNIPRRVSGYNLNELLTENGFHVARALVGTESTCALVLEATLRLVPSPPARSLLVLGYGDVYEAADDVLEVLGQAPIGLEGIDDVLVHDMRKKGLHPRNLELLPEGDGWLIAEFGGDTREEASERAQVAMESLRRAGNASSMKLLEEPEQQETVWEIRKAGLGATTRVPGEPDTWPGWEDSAVPPERLGDYLRDLRKLFQSYGYGCALYGHFGQGCIHTRVDFDLRTAAGIQHFRSFMNEAADLVLSYGGSFSGEHGDGQARAELLPKMYGEDLVSAFRHFKSVWDPQARMNPGKVVEPYRLDENLRLGSDYRPHDPGTHFSYAEDAGSFQRATLRCVGVGKCRRLESGVMCPSYQVTKEEKHSTRGRARLLFEMLQGDPLTRGWREDAVREALDLCLACKGCKGECPVNVDMATYKAEFYSHYYEGRPRPPAAYSMGLIYWWSRLASVAPTVVNAFTQNEALSAPLKRAGGVHPARRIPPFAPQTFKRWYRRRGPRNRGAPQVVLWPDTFNNHFHPAVAHAGLEVLEASGFEVIVPNRALCCGRPLYDFGMLDLAKGLLREALDTMRPHLAKGLPVVGVEPSCLAVFRDELVELFPDDADAKRLSAQSFLLSEFFEKEGLEIPRVERAAIVQAHCHHKSVMGFDAERRVMGKLGLDYEVLDSGCCGMAGSFGFEKEKYEVSVKCAERVLLPAVLSATKDTLIIADGFSCREQVAQLSGRRPLHLAQVIQMGIGERHR